MNWPTDKTCATCKHWDRAKKWETGHSLGLGRCAAIPMFWSATEWNDEGDDRKFSKQYQDTKAFAQDGSDYSAVVLTKPEFGCVSWEDRTAAQGADDRGGAAC